MQFKYMSDFLYRHGTNQCLYDYFCVVVSHKDTITLLTCDSQINRYDNMKYYHYFTIFNSANLIKRGTNFAIHIFLESAIDVPMK